MRDLLPYFALLISAIACAVSVITLFRTGRWRESDAAKALLARIDTTESRLDRLETSHQHLATKGDIAPIKAELHGVCKLVDDKVWPSIRRIEDYMMRNNRS